LRVLAAPNNLRVVTDVDHNVHTIRDDGKKTAAANNIGRWVSVVLAEGEAEPLGSRCRLHWKAIAVAVGAVRRGVR
jgi:hypothetical protein